MTRGRGVLTDTEQDFADITEALEEGRKAKPTKPSLWFVGFMAVMLLVCVGLGFWQVQRLEQKQTLIMRVEERFTSPPISLPPESEWGALDVQIYDFQPVELIGTYLPDETVLVFTSLDNAKGERSGIGYWVVTPLELATGGLVLVNRGFVPEAAKSAFDAKNTVTTPEGPQTLVGIARASEQLSAFTPGPDIINRIEYARNVPRMSAMMGIGARSVAPIYVDAEATAPNALPQAGETKIDFPNRHTEYAITWFSLAGVIFVMTGLWLWRRTRS